jgi:purine-binding chemotaxis protein CheW
MPKVQETTQPKELRVVSFQVNDREYAVDIAKVVEIIYFKPATPIPKAPAFIEGVIDLRGAVIPIVDLKKRLELISHRSVGEGTPAPPSDYILIVKIQDRLLGIVVDRVREVLQIETSKIQSPHKIVQGKNSEFLLGVCKMAERLVLLLDIETLLSTDEKDRLEGI